MFSDFIRVFRKYKDSRNTGKYASFLELNKSAFNFRLVYLSTFKCNVVHGAIGVT